MSSDSFDELDRALASGLSALAPDDVGGDDALASMRPRFERARTRRRVAKVGVSLAALFVVGSVAVLAAPSSSRSHVTVSSPPTTRSHERPPAKRTTTSGPTTTVPNTSSTSVPAPTTPSTTGSHPSPTTPFTAPVTVPQTAPNGGGPGSSGGNGHGGSPTTTTTFKGSSSVHTYYSPGGSITVRESRGSVVLLQQHPNSALGYSSETKDRGPDRVEVRFSDGTHEYRIVLQVGDNGQVVRTSHHDGPS
jgi:hypothetical protein